MGSILRHIIFNARIALLYYVVDVCVRENRPCMCTYTYHYCYYFIHKFMLCALAFHSHTVRYFTITSITSHYIRNNIQPFALCLYTHQKVALLFNSNKLLYEERTKYTRLSHRKACFWYCIASAMSFWEFVCFIYKKASSLAGWWSFFWGHYYHQHHKLLFVLPPPQLTSVKDVTSSSSF